MVSQVAASGFLFFEQNLLPATLIYAPLELLGLRCNSGRPSLHAQTGRTVAPPALRRVSSCRRFSFNALGGVFHLDLPMLYLLLIW
jgi:hypothetical protein